MISSSTVESCLVGIQFPAGSVEISERASSNSMSCPHEVMSELQHLPAKRYESQYEILKTIGQGGRPVES